MATSSALVDALLVPDIYPDKPGQVEMVQTQMSFVFLTGKYAYKIKKPVDLGYLDYTTLDKRLFFCQQELKLNRRLSPDVYLDVVSIVNNKGQIGIGGDGEVIEYAVKMKQLPREKTMDNLLIKGKVSKEMLVKVAEKLVTFHDKAATGPEISAFGELDMIKTNTEENFSQTTKYIDISITADKYNGIKSYTDNFVKDNKSLFRKRVKNGRIRDCHGDLHAAHVCFSNGIQIYDCIEFNDRFRYCDVASEIAFLAMDLDRYQRADLSQVFTNTYIELSKDAEIRNLLDFYKCYRAYVRGKVESFKLDDQYIKEKDTALQNAKGYFNLAYRYANRKPMLLILGGLVGTGKSTVAQKLNRSLGFSVVSSDIVRKELAGIPLTKHQFDDYDSGIYSEQFTINTYNEMFNKARRLLARGQSVILDASFKKKPFRLQAKKLADEAKADFIVIECTLDEASIKSRLQQRLKGSSISDGRWEIFHSQKQDFDKITEFPAQSHIILDTSQPLSNIVETIIERIWP